MKKRKTTNKQKLKAISTHFSSNFTHVLPFNSTPNICTCNKKNEREMKKKGINSNKTKTTTTKKVIDNKFVREFITLLSVSFPLDLTLKSPDNLCRNKCENIKSRCKKGEIFKQFKRKLLCQLITHLDFPRVQFIYFLQKVIVSYIKITTNTTHKKSLHVIHIRHQKSKEKKLQLFRSFVDDYAKNKSLLKLQNTHT